MPPIRRVLILALDGVQSLDVLGPVETFFLRQPAGAGSYRVDVLAPTADGEIALSNGARPAPRRGHSRRLIASASGSAPETFLGYPPGVC